MVVVLAPQEAIVRREAFGGFPSRVLQRIGLDATDQRCDQRLDDLVLEPEDLAEGAVVLLRPDLGGGQRIHEMNRHPDLLTSSPDRPPDDVAHAELAADPADLLILPSERVGGDR